ncbi:type VII secretion target [Mycobacterium sp. SMC-14]|uniref:type VII secretion target n=1 Tax=Mycobacterium sp. SMC-14 TaxID=3385968 RepID=UPI00390CCB44
MGRQQLYIKDSALRSVADRFDSTAAAIDMASRIRLGGLTFDGGTAGRDHVGAGEALRRAVQAWSPELMRWSRATSEVATALRAALARYGQAEAASAVRVG